MMISNIIVILAGCIEKEFDIYSVKALSCFIAWFPFLDKSFTKLCTLQGFFQVVLQKCRVLSLRNKISGLARQRLYKFEVVKPLFAIFNKSKDVNVRATGYDEAGLRGDRSDLDEEIRMGQNFKHMMEQFFHIGITPRAWSLRSFLQELAEHLASVDLNQDDVSYDLNIHDALSFRQQEAVDVDSLKTPQEIIENLSKALPSAVLGISAKASETEAAKAFRKLSLKFHPDKWSGQEEIAAEAFKIIGAARDAFVEKDFSRYENPIREITATDVRQECRPSASKVKYKIVQ